ncbi:hypothetical protein ACN47E_008317 [Coniothyrium glycines]
MASSIDCKDEMDDDTGEEVLAYLSLELKVERPLDELAAKFRRTRVLDTDDIVEVDEIIEDRTVEANLEDCPETEALEDDLSLV